MKEYFIGLNELNYPQRTDPQKAAMMEASLRNYILSEADKIRLTQKETRYGWLFRKKGHDQDPKFQQTLKNFQTDFVAKETDEKLYHIDQGRGKVFNHYFYKLSPKIKDLLNTLTLVWMFWPQLESPIYGFEDPSFYKENRLIAHVISHESYIYLYLEEDLAGSLMKQLGVEFKDTATWS